MVFRKTRRACRALFLSKTFSLPPRYIPFSSFSHPLHRMSSKYPARQVKLWEDVSSWIFGQFEHTILYTSLDSSLPNNLYTHFISVVLNVWGYWKVISTILKFVFFPHNVVSTFSPMLFRSSLSIIIWMSSFPISLIPVSSSSYSLTCLDDQGTLPENREQMEGWKNSKRRSDTAMFSCRLMRVWNF